nr:ATPase WRNIP1 [Tanacetum cinerariifolium]
MQRPPLFERDEFIYWKNSFKTYVKSKYLDLWHVIIHGDFPPAQNNLKTKKDEIVPFNKQSNDLKKKLAKNNEAKMGLVCSLGFLPKEIEVSDEVVEYLSQHCDGDALVALNAFEISSITTVTRLGYNENVLDLDKNVDVVLSVNIDDAKQALQRKHLYYDKDDEQHYSLISVLHKSMRGSDANASIYWLARMLESGEQPLYIAR